LDVKIADYTDFIGLSADMIMMKAEMKLRLIDWY